MTQKTSLKQRAYETILNKILNGAFTPGELLNRRGVAQMLGMSLAPAHEAMIQLERDGFIEALPRRGTRIRTARREDVRGHLIVREALECQIARMICGRPVRAHRPRLEILARQADALDKNEHRRLTREIDFHLALAALTHCPELLREYRRVMQIGFFYHINLLIATPPLKPVHHHLELLKKLAGARPDTAEAHIRKHVWSGKPEFLKQPLSDSGKPPGFDSGKDRPPDPHFCGTNSAPILNPA